MCDWTCMPVWSISMILLQRVSMSSHHPLMVTCLPILHEATLLSSLNNQLRTVMFILIVQCILMPLLNLSSSMDHHLQPIQWILFPMNLLTHLQMRTRGCNPSNRTFSLFNENVERLSRTSNNESHSCSWEAFLWIVGHYPHVSLEILLIVVL